MIYQKLLKIQQAVDKFVQDGKGQNYSYTTGSTVLNKIRPLMNEQGLILKQEVISLTNTRQDYIVGAGSDRERTKSEILSCVMQRFTWVDSETGETDVNEFAANGMNDWDKGFGSALTYAERYFLLKYFHVPTDEDDPDHGKPTKPDPVRSEEKPWLNKFLDKAMTKPNPLYNSVIQHLKGGGLYQDVTGKYRVSPATKAQIEKDIA